MSIDLALLVPKRRERDASTLVVVRVLGEGCLLNSSPHSIRSFRNSSFRQLLIPAEGAFSDPDAFSS